MNRDELCLILFEELWRLAPQAEVASVDADAPLDDALDLDSVDVIRLISALDHRLRIAIPATDYSQLHSVDALLDYLDHALEAPPPPPM